MRHLLILISLCCLTLPLWAQDADTPVAATIQFDMTVQESITQVAFYDWWQISLVTGDEIRIEMQAYDGLVPLVGLMAPDRELVARSSMDDESPEPDSLAFFEHRAETDGVYTIIATRFGNADGTSTGSYTLTALKTNFIPPRENDLLESVFRCNEMLVTTALDLRFQEEVFIPENTPEGVVVEAYRLTVYGLDGFQPVIRAFASIREERLDCSRDAEYIPNNIYTLPGAAPVTLTEADKEFSAQLGLRNASQEQFFGEVNLTMGSLDGQPGRYMAILEGLALQDRDDIDGLIVRLGPLAKTTGLTIYMVGAIDNRLDPYIEVLDANGDVLQSCDDAGLTCEDILSFANAGATLTADNMVILGDRFDAGINLLPNNTDPLYIQLSSRQRSTSGKYAIVFLGELPPTN